MAQAKVLSFGSLNLDFVYQVDHIVLGGETIDAGEVATHCGGKGLNQSIALARGGADVAHAGIVGVDGQALLDICRESGVDVSRVRVDEGRSGHTIIQVDKHGQNSIILFGGTNRGVTQAYIDEALEGYGEGDLIVLQNEVNMLPQIIESAAARGMRVVLNPSPFDARIDECDLSRVWLFFVNEIEGEQITGKNDPAQILDAFAERYPGSNVVLTLGSDGAVAQFGGERFEQPIIPTTAVDTTAAGDTFSGFFLAEYLRSEDVAQAMLCAAQASSIAVSRAGAAPSIPALDEVRAALGA
ncbi:ribokinase [Paratractidigestivibacter sp.]|uniref:ribokinase n=1 Tax=Paratractidigestivibacter sp. TaxID=2847316 RepID=UPI002AC8FF70|nr:ribokinase [Paratractidigestivibacter sp.]